MHTHRCRLTTLTQLAQRSFEPFPVAAGKVWRLERARRVAGSDTAIYKLSSSRQIRLAGRFCCRETDSRYQREDAHKSAPNDLSSPMTDVQFHGILLSAQRPQGLSSDSSAFRQGFVTVRKRPLLEYHLNCRSFSGGSEKAQNGRIQGMQPWRSEYRANRGIILGGNPAWQDVCLMLCCGSPVISFGWN